MIRFSYFILLIVLVAGCKVNTEPESTKSFVIIDQTSNKVINNYEYSVDTEKLVRTESYNENGEIVKSSNYEYDDAGNLNKTIKASRGYPTKSISYETEDIYDSSGNLIKTIRTSSDGQLIETFYGYDDTGKLRGVVEQIDKSAVMMQDYDN